MIALLSCAHPGALPSLGKGEHQWVVGVLAASGDDEVEALYVLETAALGGEVWRVRTARTSGTWREGAFDSEAPSGSDPWPLVLQHVVASVPADVRVEDGRVVALVDPEGWRERARSALYHQVDLPPEAAATGEPLLDPDGLLADLQRTFPGLPPNGLWERAERIAGVDALRTETCTGTSDGAARTWTCEGTATTPPGGPARLFEVTTRTTLAAGRDGLIWSESAYEGTLVLLAPDGAGVVDRPIVGRRRVERREVSRGYPRRRAPRVAALQLAGSPSDGEPR